MVNPCRVKSYQPMRQMASIKLSSDQSRRQGTVRHVDAVRILDAVTPLIFVKLGVAVGAKSWLTI